MVHQGVPIENAFTHLYDIEVVVSQRHPVPEEGAIAWLRRLPIPVLANHVLDSV